MMRRLGTLKHTFQEGQMQTVEDDVLNIIRKMKEISPRLTCYWNEHRDCFTITETSLDGSTESLVMNVELLDERVLDRLLTADQWQGREDPSNVLPEGEDFLASVEADEQRWSDEIEAQQQDRRAEILEEIASYADKDGKGTKAQILVPGWGNRG
jgi:hypothetical protein